MRNSIKAWGPLWFSWVPSHSQIPWSTSAWESSETRSDIAQSSPADRQSSYCSLGLWLSQVSASSFSSAAVSALGKAANWSASVFLRNFGGLFWKNLVCEERASWDKRPNFLDWLFWSDLAIGRKTKKTNQVKMTNVATGTFFSYINFKEFCFQSAIREYKRWKKRLVQLKFSQVECHCNNTTAQCEVQINILKNKRWNQLWRTISHLRQQSIGHFSKHRLHNARMAEGGRHALQRQINAALIYCIYI